LRKIADNVSSRLQTIPAYRREPTSRRVLAQLEMLTAVTTDEVVRTAYRPGHSTEKALVNVINDVITAAC